MKRIVALVFIVVLWAAPTAGGFVVPEKLVFDLTWTGIKAGTATLEFTRDGEFMKIVSTARSADWVSVFYTVDDRVETKLAHEKAHWQFGRPLTYKIKLREGKHRKDKEVIFDHAKLKATYIDHLEGEKKELEILDHALDPLTSFFYVRTVPLEVGKPVYVDLFDSKKMWRVEVQVLRKEKIKTPLGTFDTIVIKPQMTSEGIFYRKGDIVIWLTDDEKRLPVKMQTKVAVGAITGTLVGEKY